MPTPYGMPKSIRRSMPIFLVRVAGYSDYFVHLDPVVQTEIIERAEQAAF